MLAERSPKPRMSASRRGEESGDRLDVGEAFGLFDQRTSRPILRVRPELLFEAVEHGLEEPDVARLLDLREDDDVEVLARAFDDADHVVDRPAGGVVVDAHGAHLVAPVEVVQGVDRDLARALLLLGGDGVLQVEEDEVGVALRRLLDHPRVAGRHRQLGTSQSHGGVSFSGRMRARRLPGLQEPESRTGRGSRRGARRAGAPGGAPRSSSRCT